MSRTIVQCSGGFRILNEKGTSERIVSVPGEIISMSANGDNATVVYKKNGGKLATVFELKHGTSIKSFGI